MKTSLSVVKLGGAHANAPIEMWISANEVGIRMPLDEFIRALVAKVGNPSLVMTQAQLKAKLDAAAAEIVAGMKTETIKIV
jgi:tRNA A37 threonylcarbamoyladenosine synthetase subunit TsaC/SUA5/YrdC